MRSIRSAASRIKSTAASLVSVACAIVRASPRTSPTVCGSSAITIGWLSSLLGDLPDVVNGDGAHLAERLGDDQVGLQLVQKLRVELVDRLARERALLDRGVDLRRGEPRRQLVARDPWQLADGGWVVALMSDGDDFVAEAEREEHLGRRRDQAYDAHMRSTI